jgi:hypothetical protein
MVVAERLHLDCVQLYHFPCGPSRRLPACETQHNRGTLERCRSICANPKIRSTNFLERTCMTVRLFVSFNAVILMHHTLPITSTTVTYHHSARTGKRLLVVHPTRVIAHGLNHRSCSRMSPSLASLFGHLVERMQPATFHDKTEDIKGPYSECR